MARGNGRNVWQLAAREHVLLDDAHGTRLRVTRGTLWITLERDPRDVVVTTGDAFTIDRPGRTIVEAQDRSTVRVDAPSRGRAIMHGIVHPLLRWLRSTGKAAANRRFAPYY